MSKKGKLKRGSATSKVYEKGSQSAVTAKAQEDYNKINFKNAAIDNFNKITSRVGSSERRKSGNPFGGISGFSGFGSAPQLGYKNK